MVKRLAVLPLAFLFAGCPGSPGPEPTPTPEPTPPYTESCQELLDQGLPWCHEAEPPMQCGECVHNPTDDPRHCEKAPDCGGTELPEPQCPQFMDRGGTVRPTSDSCDCYFGHTWNPCEPEPSECSFPQGIPNENFEKVPNPGTLGSVVNATMADLSGCSVGTRCPITFHPDVWMGLVCDRLRAQGFCCGRHVDTPPGHEVCPPGSGCTDQISVKREDFCDGRPHENYQIYNYGGKEVRWAPGATQDGWAVECVNGPAPTPTPPPPSGDCPPPHPNTDYGRINAKEHNGILDTTLVFVNSCDYCAAIGMPCMPGTGPEPPCTPRCGCPIRQEGDPERAPCEAEICGQVWECNGEPYPPYRGNPAQSDCRGHWKTWCSHAPNIMSEGNR